MISAAGNIISSQSNFRGREGEASQISLSEGESGIGQREEKGRLGYLNRLQAVESVETAVRGTCANGVE